MRKIVLTLCSALLLIACTQEFGMTPSPQDDYLRIPVNLFNEIEQQYSTRVNDEGFCDNDKVGIYIVNYDGSTPGTLKLSGNQADNVGYVYNESTRAWIPEHEVYYLDNITHVDVIGYYPYANPSSVDAYPFEVERDQSKDAANGLMASYEASDFLFAKAENVVPSAGKVSLRFRHKMASVRIELKKGSGWSDEEWNQVSKQVLVANTIRKSTINLNDGTVTPVGAVPETDIVPAKYGESWRAIVVPQTVAAGTVALKLTIDGMTREFMPSSGGEYINVNYLAGKMTTFSLNVSKKTQSGIEIELAGLSITAWENDNMSHDATAREYIVIHCAEPGTLKECIIASGNDYTKLKNLKVTGTINAHDFYVMKSEMTKLQSVNLKEVKIASSPGRDEDAIPSDAFSGKSTLIRIILPDSITKIGYDAFQGTNLTGSLIIPNGVKTIGNSAFYGLTGLAGTLTLSNSLEEIGSLAFYNCGFIGELDLPRTLKEIGSSAFSQCSGFMGSLVLPDDLETLESGAFASCSGLTGSLTIPHKLKKLENNIFSGCSGLNGQLELPDDLEEIGDSVFSSCRFRGNLNLPKNLIIIGQVAFAGNLFSGNLVLPESLAVIKQGAFSGCERLTGIVEVPEDIASIAPNTFRYCSNLEGVVLSKNVEAIREGAFFNCFQLNSIVCKAQNPPIVSSSAFSGVAKDNFTVEVPEQAVANYSTTPGWNEFKRFAAHREFSISRNLFRTLNASHSKTFVVRAPSGSSWSIESKPEWVTVSPSSGTGKVEVTVTTSALAQGAGNREGEVVFLLDGKDYRSSMKVQQYDYQYGDGSVVTRQTASQGSGIDLVFMGDCFDAKDISEGKYLDGVEEAIGYFFDIEPYRTYRNYFNVYVVFGMSADSGIGSVNTIRESKFGSAYGLQGSGSIGVDEATCFEYACLAPTVTESKIGKTLITMVENTEEYDGITYMWGDNSAIALCPMSRDEYPYDFRGIVQHEAGGHGFGKLGDEYIYTNGFIQSCICPNPHVDSFNAGKSHGWYDNLSLSGNMHEVPWSHLIFDETYSDLVDIYEGGYFHTRGVFRSEPNSCMNNNIPISRESIVKRIKDYAGETYSFEDFKAHDVLTPATVGTRADAFLGLPLITGNRQSAPIYVGEKPNFKKN